ncbi:hypothetical protein PFNF54_04762 [Plasmodium falciparum NF54]|uniref:Uncharacterized protein n=1 Tax=Plasmodium falciparum (isolate NF54) TaxID=5843 RepID=W7K0H4_PLAFO|nr:hypothetical protein PFNF54_04762 [Plasmodium falciparum NF54]
MVNPPFDINYFLSSCTNLEKSYEHLLKEKKLYELKLNQALISLQEINEKYEEERKNVSLRISEQTHKIIKNENIFEDVQRQNEELKEKIEEINKEKELEKEYLYLKKSLSKTSTKKHLITKRIQGKSICNNKISYKI